MATITQMQYLLAVQKTKHFGRAAEACNVAQPSLSAQIQKLEDELGFMIFDRSKKPILTTDLGLQVLELSKEILAKHGQLLSVRDRTDEVSGNFHLGVIPTLAPYVVPLFVRQFTEEHPDLRLKVTEMQTTDIIEALREDKIDGGLLVTPLEEPDLIERPIFREPFYAFVSDSHPLKDRKIINEKDLTGKDLWLLDEGHCFRDQVLSFCKLTAKPTSHDNLTFDSGSLETLIQLVRNGAGYTLLPHLALSNLSAAEKKKYIKPFSSPQPTREVSLVHSRVFYKDSILSALTHSIADSLPDKVHNFKKSKTKVISIK